MNLISSSEMNTPRTMHSTTRLGGGGLILIVGGLDASGNPLASAELFDPATGVFTTIDGALNTARYGHTAIVTAGGGVFLMGGLSSPGAYLASVEIFTPGANPATTGAFTAASTGLSTARAGMRAELLPDGRILVTGGQDSGDQALSTAEVYAPKI